MRRIALMYDCKPTDVMDGINPKHIVPGDVGGMARAMTAAGCSVDIYSTTKGITQMETHYWGPRVRLICLPENTAAKAGSEFYAVSVAREILQHILLGQLVYDFFQAGSLFWVQVATQIKKVTGTPIVLCLYPFGRDPEDIRHSPVEDFARQHSREPFANIDIDWLILASRRHQVELLRLYGVRPSRTSVLRPGSLPSAARHLGAIYYKIEANCRSKRYGQESFDLLPLLPAPMAGSVPPFPAGSNNSVGTQALVTLRKLLPLALFKTNEGKYG